MSYLQKKYLLTGVLLILCIGYIPSLIRAQVPDEAYIERDYPNLHSVFQIPVRMCLGDLQESVNQQIKGLIYEAKDQDAGNGSRYSMKIWKLDEIELEGEGKHLYSVVPLKIWVKGNFKIPTIGGLKVNKKIDQDFLLLSKFQSSLSLDAKWNIISNTKLLKYKWIEEPTISVIGFKFDISSFLDDYIEENKTLFTKILDEQIQKRIALKKIVEEAWKYFQKPYPASEWGEEKVWLQLSPYADTVHLKRLAFNNGRMESILSFKAKTFTQLSQKPPHWMKIKPLPPLQLKDKLGQGVIMVMNGSITRQTAIKKAKEVFLNKEYSFRKGKYKFKVLDIDIYGSNENFVIALDLKGSVNGKAYLIGKPVYYQEKKQMQLQDFRYEVKGEMKISKFTRWLFASKIKNQLREATEEVINAQILDIRKQVEEGLEYLKLNDQSVLRGEVLDFHFDKLYMTPNDIFSKVILLGKFVIDLEGI